jgi:PTH2 family peptidyl-tRNA hydrolase
MMQSIARSTSPVKFILCVRSDLNMSTGKIAAQCCHATSAMERDAARSLAGGASEVGMNSAYGEWRSGAHGEAKIVLDVPNAATLDFVEQGARALGVKTFRVQDAGRTEVEPGTVTVLGIGPVRADVIDDVTGKLKLLK